MTARRRVLGLSGAVLCAVVCAALAVGRTARAEDPSESDEPAPARSVEIVVVGSERELELIRGTLGPESFDGASARWERASRLEVSELLERRPQASDVQVRAWVDLSDSRSASLYFADRAGERFLVRAVALPRGLSALGREALGQVLELSVRALLEDDRVGMTRSETRELLKARGSEEAQPKTPPPDVPPEPEPPPAVSEASLGAEAFYAVRLFSSQVPIVHGPGLALSWIAESDGQRTLFWAQAQYELPREFRSESVSVHFTTIRVEGGLGMLFPVADSAFRLGGRAGGGADFTSVTPGRGTSGESVALESSRVSTTPTLNLAAVGSVPLARRLDASLELFAGFYPIRVHYDLLNDTERSRVLVPYWVRPGIRLSVQLR